MSTGAIKAMAKSQAFVDISDKADRRKKFLESPEGTFFQVFTCKIESNASNRFIAI